MHKSNLATPSQHPQVALSTRSVQRKRDKKWCSRRTAPSVVCILQQVNPQDISGRCDMPAERQGPARCILIRTYHASFIFEYLSESSTEIPATFDVRRQQVWGLVLRDNCLQKRTPVIEVALCLNSRTQCLWSAELCVNSPRF